MPTEIHKNKNGTWIPIVNLDYNDAGVYRSITEVHYKDGANWRQVFGAAVSAETLSWNTIPAGTYSSTGDFDASSEVIFDVLGIDAKPFPKEDKKMGYVDLLGNPTTAKIMQNLGMSIYVTRNNSNNTALFTRVNHAIEMKKRTDAEKEKYEKAVVLCDAIFNNAPLQCNGVDIAKEFFEVFDRLDKEPMTKQK